MFVVDQFVHSDFYSYCRSSRLWSFCVQIKTCVARISPIFLFATSYKYHLASFPSLLAQAIEGEVSQHYCHLRALFLRQKPL